MADLVDEVRQAADGRVLVCGVGCGGPMAGHGETVSPLNIGGWREFPLRQRLAALTGVPTFVDNDAKALALAEGWTGAAQGTRRLSGDGRLDGGRWWDRPRRPPARRAARQRRAHRPCRRRAGRPPVRLRRSGLPGGGGVGDGDRRGDGPADRRTRRRRWSNGRARSSAGRWRRWRRCSTSIWRSSPGRWRSGSAGRSSRRPGASCGAGPAMPFSAGTRLLPAGLGAEGPLVGAGAVGWRGIDGGWDGGR